MFRKNKAKPFDLFLNQAKELSNNLYELSKTLRQISDNAEDRKELTILWESLGDKLKKEILALNLLITPEKDRQPIIDQIHDKNELARLEVFTTQRDFGFRQIQKLVDNLNIVNEAAENQLIQAMEIKDKAHYRKVIVKTGHLKQKIANLTEDDLVKIFTAIKDAYHILNQIVEQNFLGVFVGLAVAPDKRTPEAFARDLYRMRAAFYKDNESYQTFQAMVKEVSKITDVLAVFTQYLDTHPDSRHYSKELLNRLEPIFKEINTEFQATIEAMNNIIKAIEQGRQYDYEQTLALAGLKK